MAKKKSRQSQELRGGVSGGATTGATRQPAGKKEAKGRGGMQEAKGSGGISGQEAAERREDERRQRHGVRHCDNQPEAETKPPPPHPPPRLRFSPKKGVMWNSKEQSYGVQRVRYHGYVIIVLGKAHRSIKHIAEIILSAFC